MSNFNLKTDTAPTSTTVRAEMTPNPQTLRFVASQAIADRTADFTDAKQTALSPLARKLFGFPWAAGVFIGRDFVTVTKQEWVDWEILAEPLTDLIQEHLERGEIVLHPDRSMPNAGAPGSSSAHASAVAGNDSDDVLMIKKVLNDEIRPAVALDGGDVVFHKFENGVVELFMQGSCAGCPSSTMTLKMGIETRLKEAVPTIREVVAI
jgi:Fe-S cluster biogenesis protein NfuA